MDEREERPTGSKIKSLFRMILAMCLLGDIMVLGICLGLYPLLGGWGSWMLGLVLYGALVLGMAAFMHRFMNKIKDVRVRKQPEQSEPPEQSRQPERPEEARGKLRVMSVNAG